MFVCRYARPDKKTRKSKKFRSKSKLGATDAYTAEYDANGNAVLLKGDDGEEPIYLRANALKSPSTPQRRANSNGHGNKDGDDNDPIYACAVPDLDASPRGLVSECHTRDTEKRLSSSSASSQIPAVSSTFLVASDCCFHSADQS